ncbi:hypothetical protein MFLAVUS_006706 [Mucor flavus]|uniref:Uncharacterized protein n=1 Tax=Mucor flavus TaxID=439312 RepID=A0ABP9Z2A4_9FUNG
MTAYEATKIQTVYHNATIVQFERISRLTDDLKKKGCSVEDITGLVTQLELAISSKDINQVPKNFLD